MEDFTLEVSHFPLIISQSQSSILRGQMNALLIIILSRSKKVDLTFFILFFILFFFSIYFSIFLFLEQLELGLISHAITSVT